ncbi:MAG: 4Fe-4S binding protein, partial [Pseudomonadota bacterium]
MDIVRGRITRLTGALGAFALEVDGFAALEPGGRGARSFGSATNGARSECDIVVDLSGDQPLVPAHWKRDGYLRAEPSDPVGLERALFDAAQLVGTFEKTLHIAVTEALCAHSRAEQTGCTRCLSVCPTSAITPNGDHISIDPRVCAGCGACAAVCPSGAAASVEPPVDFLFRRMRSLAEAYRTAGGEAPRLLVHDGHGAEMIQLGARFGRGLPADVIPLEVTALAAFGHAEQLAALGLGFSGVDLLAGPKAEIEPMRAEMAVAEAIVAGTAGGPRLRLVEEQDPDALMELLHGEAPEPHGADPILAAGGRRETVRLAARALAGGATETPVPLPTGAPYGAVVVNPDACTLCLSCAGLCPTGALGDNPDRPELTFREEACIQCGLCAGLCPESAITLVPQLELSDAALTPRTLKEEEPFACIECGKLFGVKSTIERITEKLSTHAMFQNSDNAKLIQMCDDCRVKAQFHSDSAPFSFGERPRVRTTDDYLGGSDD